MAAAIVSSYSDRPVREGTVAFGEIGLSGEVRPVAQSAARLKEAAKLGFTHALAPQPGGRKKKKAEAAPPEISIQTIGQVNELLDLLAPAKPARVQEA